MRKYNFDWRVNQTMPTSFGIAKSSIVREEDFDLILQSGSSRTEPEDTNKVPNELAALRQSIAAAEAQLFLKEEALKLNERKVKVEEKELELQRRKDELEKSKDSKEMGSDQAFRVAVLKFNDSGFYLKHGHYSKALGLANEAERILRQEAYRSEPAASLLPSARRMIQLAGSAARGSNILSAPPIEEDGDAEIDLGNSNAGGGEQEHVASSASTMQQEIEAKRPVEGRAEEIGRMEEEVTRLRSALALETERYDSLLEGEGSKLEDLGSQGVDLDRMANPRPQDIDVCQDAGPERDSKDKWSDLIWGDLAVSGNTAHERVDHSIAEPHADVLSAYSPQPVVLPHQPPQPRTRQVQPSSPEGKQREVHEQVGSSVGDDVAFRVRTGEEFEPEELCVIRRSDATWRFGQILRALGGSLYCVAVSTDMEKIGVPGDNLGKLVVEEGEASAVVRRGLLPASSSPPPSSLRTEQPSWTTRPPSNARAPSRDVLPTAVGSLSLGMVVSEEAPGPKTWGVNGPRQGPQVFVWQLVAGGPADMAGIMVGDVLESIDNEPVSRLTFQQVCAKLRGDSKATSRAVRVSLSRPTTSAARPSYPTSRASYHRTLYRRRLHQDGINADGAGGSYLPQPERQPSHQPAAASYSSTFTVYSPEPPRSLHPNPVQQAQPAQRSPAPPTRQSAPGRWMDWQSWRASASSVLQGRHQSLRGTERASWSSSAADPSSAPSTGGPLITADLGFLEHAAAPPPALASPADRSQPQALVRVGNGIPGHEESQSPYQVRQERLRRMYEQQQRYKLAALHRHDLAPAAPSRPGMSASARNIFDGWGLAPNSFPSPSTPSPPVRVNGAGHGHITPKTHFMEFEDQVTGTPRVVKRTEILC